MIKFCLWRYRQELWRQPLFQSNFILTRPSLAIFADIIKIVTIFIKTIFEDSKNFKELEIMYQNETYICISW